MESELNKHTPITEDKLVAISYGAFFSLIAALSSIFVWVGMIQASVADIEKSSDTVEVREDKRTEKIDKLIESISDFNSRLSKIEGILEELRRK